MVEPHCTLLMTNAGTLIKSDISGAPGSQQQQSKLPQQPQPLSNGGSAWQSTLRASQPRVSKLRRALGMCATFVVSGLVHEFIIAMMLEPREEGCGMQEGVRAMVCRRPWLGKWTVFFSMQVGMGGGHCCILFSLIAAFMSAEAETGHGGSWHAPSVLYIPCRGQHGTDKRYKQT
jgi:hypothetical protein